MGAPHHRWWRILHDLGKPFRHHPLLLLLQLLLLLLLLLLMMVMLLLLVLVLMRHGVLLLLLLLLLHLGNLQHMWWTWHVQVVGLGMLRILGSLP